MLQGHGASHGGRFSNYEPVWPTQRRQQIWLLECKVTLPCMHRVSYDRVSYDRFGYDHVSYDRVSYDRKVR